MEQLDQIRKNLLQFKQYEKFQQWLLGKQKVEKYTALFVYRAEYNTREPYEFFTKLDEFDRLQCIQILNILFDQILQTSQLDKMRIIEMKAFIAALREIHQSKTNSKQEYCQQNKKSKQRYELSFKKSKRQSTPQQQFQELKYQFLNYCNEELKNPKLGEIGTRTITILYIVYTTILRITNHIITIEGTINRIEVIVKTLETEIIKKYIVYFVTTAFTISFGSITPLITNVITIFLLELNQRWVTVATSFLAGTLIYFILAQKQGWWPFRNKQKEVSIKSTQLKNIQQQNQLRKELNIENFSSRGFMGTAGIGRGKNTTKFIK